MKHPFYDLKALKKKLTAHAEKNFSPEDRKKIGAALAFAVRKHKGQRRAEGTSYIIHPIRVALILIENVGTWDADIVATALLHDVVEDCGVRLNELRKRFGKRVAYFVEEMTRRRRKGESDAEKEIRKKEKLAALKKAPLEVQLIKCADILDNLRCAGQVPWWAWTPLARRKFARWHREYHYALDFAKAAHPVLYKEIQKALRAFDLKRIIRGFVRWKI